MKYFIGIDPGVNVGYALWNSQEKKFYCLATMGFWDTIKKLSELKQEVKQLYTVVIEDPNLNKPTFFRKGQNKFMMQKISQNVGSNKRDATLLIEWLQYNGFKIQRVKPTSAKWKDDLFKRLTGHKGRTSQHVRDAAKLVFGL
jgi:hypothetical protein